MANVHPASNDPAPATQGKDGCPAQRQCLCGRIIRTIAVAVARTSPVWSRSSPARNAMDPPRWTTQPCRWSGRVQAADLQLQGRARIRHHQGVAVSATSATTWPGSLTCSRISRQSCWGGCAPATTWANH